MTGERCAACGNSTVVQTARGAGCVSCGAGITSVFGRRVARFTPKGRKRHQHRWNYLGTTTETGVQARKEHVRLGRLWMYGGVRCRERKARGSVNCKHCGSQQLRSTYGTFAMEDIEKEPYVCTDCGQTSHFTFAEYVQWEEARVAELRKKLELGGADG